MDAVECILYISRYTVHFICGAIYCILGDKQKREEGQPW